MSVEVCQGRINATYGTGFSMRVTCCSTRMSVAYGRDGKDAGPNGQIVPARKLEEIAGR